MTESVCILPIIQVTQAVDLSLLVEKLQDERAAVALNIFLNRTSGENSISDLQKYSRNEMNLTRFNLMTVSVIVCINISRTTIRTVSKCLKYIFNYVTENCLVLSGNRQRTSINHRLAKNQDC